MCLKINLNNTTRFKNRYKNKPKTKIKVKKLVVIYKNLTGTGNNISEICKIQTPYQYADVEGGWLKPSKSVYDSYYIEGGAIHCYSINEKIVPGFREALLNCWAYAEDFIGQGIGEHMAFKKIWVPIEEVERVIKNYKRKTA